LPPQPLRQAPMAPESNDKVAFQVMTLGDSEGPVVSAAAGTTVRELRELVAAAMEAEAVALKLVVGDLLLEDNERPVQEACAEAWAAAVAEQRPVDLMVVKLPMREMSAASEERKTWEANAHPVIFNHRPGVPTGGDYDHTSEHYWPNHSGGGTYVRLELPETRVKILEVKARVKALDQGWGGEGNAGVAVVLLDGGGNTLAYSVQSLKDHGEKTLEWVMTPEDSGASFPNQEGSKECDSVCAEGEGLVLEIRPFTPNWGGWSVSALEGELKATILG